ncbi:hypothetical protein VARIO8X_50097 [Burkholderiales bacterium 8X]|nr:hypothetical protein VARIO8X_50097 [Burkholderiales bacterium 8X]
MGPGSRSNGSPAARCGMRSPMPVASPNGRCRKPRSSASSWRSPRPDSAPAVPPRCATRWPGSTTSMPASWPACWRRTMPPRINRRRHEVQPHPTFERRAESPPLAPGRCQRRAGARDGRRPRAGAGLPEPPDQPRRRLPARRLERHRGPHPGAAPGRGARRSGGGGQQARQQCADRHRIRRPRRARRLHPDPRQREPAGDQPRHLRQDALRRIERPGRHHDGRQHARAGRGASIGAGQDHAGTDRLVEDARGDLVLVGQRRPAAPGDRAAAHRHARQVPARALQGRRAGRDRHGGRPCRRRHHGFPGAAGDGGRRQAASDRHHQHLACAFAAGDADLGGAGRADAPRVQLVRRDGACQDPAADHRQAACSIGQGRAVAGGEGVDAEGRCRALDPSDAGSLRGLHARRDRTLGPGGQGLGRQGRLKTYR